MRDIYPNGTFNISTFQKLGIVRNRSKAMKSKRRKIEDVKKVKICSIGNLSPQTAARFQNSLVKNQVEQWNLRGMKFPFHLILFPSGRMSRSLRFDEYVENPYFDEGTLGICYLRAPETAPGVWQVKAISRLYSFLKEESLKWIWPNPLWPGLIETEKPQNNDFFNRLWDEHFVDKEKGVGINELKSFMEAMYSSISNKLDAVHQASVNKIDGTKKRNPKINKVTPHMNLQDGQ